MTEPTKPSPGVTPPNGSNAKPAPSAASPPVKPAGQAAAPPPAKPGATPSSAPPVAAKPATAAPVSPPPPLKPTITPPPPAAAAPPPKPPAPPASGATAALAGTPGSAAAKPGGPPPPPPPRAEPPRADPPRGSGRSALAVFSALGFVVLLCGLYYLYMREEQLAATQAGTEQRLTQVETRASAPPPASTVDLKPLEARVAALEQRVQSLARAAAAPPPAAAPTPSAAPTPAAPPPAASTPAAAPPPETARAEIAGAVAPLSERLAALEKRLSDAEQKSTQADQRAQLAEQKVGQIAAQAATVNDQAARATRIEQAAVALNAGLPLGDIPAAPPSLAKFAKTKPPTEAELRLAFPAAAARAAEASRPPTLGQSLLQRMWLHVRSLVTIRDGDKVLVGAPAATVLAQAQGRLDAGDIAGAVATLGALDGAAAQAIAGWRDQAQSLLDARAALAKMANG